MTAIKVRAVQVGEADPANWAPTLDAEETARAASFRLPEDRLRFVLGRSLLRTMLAEAFGVPEFTLPFRYSQFGKPELPQAGGVAFNVAHSGGLVMAAVGRAQAIGLDVEQHREDIDCIALGKHVLTGAEEALLRGAPPKQRAALFFDYWVAKESLLKGLGSGLSVDPRTIAVGLAGDMTTLLLTPADPAPDFAGWQARRLWVGAGYSAALAVLPSV